MPTKTLLETSASERCALAMDLGGMGSFVWSLDDNMAVGDARVGELFGIEEPDRPRSAADFLARVHDDDIDALMAAKEAIENDADYIADFRVQRDDGSWRWLTGRGRVVGSEHGQPQLVGVNWDVSHRKEQESRLEMLAREMNHRVKNAFAVMLALISLGSKSATDAKSFAETIKAQIKAMSDAHLISARPGLDEGGETSFSIGDILRTALAPWIERPGAPRVTIEDDTSRLPVDKLSALAMLVYELATNAVKYGALGRDEGSLSVRIESGDDDIMLCWIETIGDTRALRTSQQENAKGVKAGFGSMLIQHCTSVLQAKVKRDMRPEGLLVELRMPK